MCYTLFINKWIYLQENGDDDLQLIKNLINHISQDHENKINQSRKLTIVSRDIEVLHK